MPIAVVPTLNFATKDNRDKVSPDVLLITGSLSLTIKLVSGPVERYLDTDNS